MKRVLQKSLYASVFASISFILPAIAQPILVRLSWVSIDEVPFATRSELLHPKYKLPSRCFAYVGNTADTKSWKLPYLLPDGRPDLKRLPKAIQAVIGNYRGAKVTGIPERQLPEVLIRLGRAAVIAGKMPFQVENTAPIYRQLQARLEKLGRLEEVKANPPPVSVKP